MEFYLLLVSFLIIAMIYSSVGFGGGSSYLALMAAVGISRSIMSPTALLCNIVVVVGGTILYFREGLIDFRKNWPLLAAGVPFAFIGGYWRIRDDVFFLLLGATLVVAAVLLWTQTEDRLDKPATSFTLPTAVGLGAAIGLLSGLVSIGGGIFLSPVLHMLRWDQAHRISAIASLFILVNSVSGLAGNLLKSPELDWKFIFPLLIAVLAGGQIGSRLGARKFNVLHIKRITAVLILLAGMNILWDHT